MGSSQSSHSNDTTAPPQEGKSNEVRGRKYNSTTMAEEGGNPRSIGDIPPAMESSDDYDDLSDEEFQSSDEEDWNEDDDDEEEDEEELRERLLILEETRKLKFLATTFLHPELPVQVDPAAKARCYFDRPSAPEVMDKDEAEAMAEALEDAQKLRQLAVDYAHPKVPVVVSDATACARNFFDRPSAHDDDELDDDDDDDEEERELALKDASMLRKAAFDYLHPEVGVTTTDASAVGRNYFDRASAPDQDTLLEVQRARVLKDAEALKKLAVDYAHPEAHVKTTDPTSFGRNYFTRPSAPEQDEDLEDECARIMAEVTALKKHAVDYAHPEVAITKVDPTVFGRNYFERPSAPKQAQDEDYEERARVLAEAAALKKQAVAYAHPEVGISNVDPTLFGRNYFNRPSADEEDEESSEERELVLAEMAALKKLAADYAHPEVGVTVTDATVFGRNYFSRPSAPEQEDDEDLEERQSILAEAAALKKMAVDYTHPEVGVSTTDPTAFGRNYFSRPSAPEQEDKDADERARIMAEVAALKKHAVDYAHPEVGVANVDPTLFGRNYFERPSAPEQEEDEDYEDRALILAEAAALKKQAIAYSHPEVGVSTTDPTLFGRNYFSRPSAPEQEDDEDFEERQCILAEAAALKKMGVDYAHPEVGVSTTDPTAFGRNYFSRPSAPEQEDEDAEERSRVLAEVAALKKHAVDYAHPEVGIRSVDPTLFGRNYFSRPSAPEQEQDEDYEELAHVLADAAALKKQAAAYAHPEVGVTTSDPTAFGRNYFSRPSAPVQEDKEESEERSRVLAEAAALKKFAVDYAHPEVGVSTTDPTGFGRNYFDRPSVPHEGITTHSEVPIKQRLEYHRKNSFDSHDTFDHSIDNIPFEMSPLVGKRTLDVSTATRTTLAGSLDSFDTMVDDDLGKLKQALTKGMPSHQPLEEIREKDEGDLSRSPSCVMLFGLEGTTNQEAPEAM